MPRVTYTYTPPGQESEEETQTVYYNPIFNSGYDPDGLQELFTADEIDWDGFDWDTWNWVIIGDELEEGETESGEVHQGSVADGAEIDFEYYQNDPLYQMAFANLGIEIGDIDYQHLKHATRYVVETYRLAANDKGWREPWEDPLPEQKPLTRLKTNYKTPFDIPGIAAPLPGAQMSSRLEALKARTGSDMEGEARLRASLINNQPGFSQAIDPNWPTYQTNEAGDRTGIGGKYVMDQYRAGKTLRQIEREAKNKGWTIGPHAQALFDGEVDIK